MARCMTKKNSSTEGNDAAQHSNNQGPHSPTILKNILCLFPKILESW